MALPLTLSTSNRYRAAEAAALAALDDLLGSLRLPDGRLTPNQLEEVPVKVAGRPELWRDLVVDSLEHRWWLILHRSANYDVRLLTWEVDQASDWHDHGGSSGGFVVVDGLLEERYRAVAGAGLRARSLAAGARGSFGPAHVHDMKHGCGRPAVSIHAYSPPLTVLTTYRETPYGLVASGVRPDDER